ncbi:glycoside hydrolase family 130 protein [Phototrophicus methaneseepsis]|uniref:Glycoside hydrolase family 130 protein n=1 Tax=Phototrophicus methaneseepsis TaxID=2710758 RepID=A0A7S8E8K4_9CHLR|nr:glycoside hydrolase family 130 protein [Phototrophicus methaneseepsis]QPC82357.1 glycoside hydrolase family 130 protein [Phototrophicus methaneseepsis]
MFTRHPSNPLISPNDVTPSRPGFEIIGTFNAGACTFNNEVYLLVRVAEKPVNEDKSVIACPHYVNGELVVEHIRRDDPDWDTSDPRQIRHLRSSLMYLTSVSHLRLARSKDGATFKIDPEPWLLPQTEYEGYGVEDARITEVEGRYYINYTAVSMFGITTALVSTADFVSIERHGLIFPSSNRDVTIFPQRVNGKYVCYHRPMPMFGGLHIWSATSPDLVSWGDHRILLSSSESGWMNGRVGGGAPPVLTDAGWLSIFHAADKNDRYCLGAFITPADDPTTIIASSKEPIMAPEAPYETSGFFSDVVFTCGAVVRGDELWVYYGTADEHTAVASAKLQDLVAHVMGN